MTGVEIMNSMRQPGRFTSAVSTSTPVMSVAYLALGAIGYWSQGMGVQEIIIFGTGYDTWSRIAAGAILFQVRRNLMVADPVAYWCKRAHPSHRLYIVLQCIPVLCPYL